MTDPIIRQATQSEFATAINWAAAEGWNPGKDDLAAFFKADPGGFYMGWKENRPVSCISVVRYGKSYGFLGFYIVHPDWRGTGLGMATWEAGLAHLEGRTVGLNGVMEQQQNYSRSGFQIAGIDTRYTGVPERKALGHVQPQIRFLRKSDQFDVLNYQRPFFPDDRDVFIENWMLRSNSDTRRSLGAFDDGRLTGIGTIRECQKGYKIGPLFADDETVAAALFQGLSNLTPHNAEVCLDLPEDNPAALYLAQTFSLTPVFQTARMWKGDLPSHQTRRTFGLSTFELG